MEKHFSIFVANQVIASLLVMMYQQLGREVGLCTVAFLKHRKPHVTWLQLVVVVVVVVVQRERVQGTPGFAHSVTVGVAE